MHRTRSPKYAVYSQKSPLHAGSTLLLQSPVGLILKWGNTSPFIQVDNVSEITWTISLSTDSGVSICHIKIRVCKRRLRVFGTCCKHYENAQNSAVGQNSPVFLTMQSEDKHLWETFRHNISTTLFLEVSKAAWGKGKHLKKKIQNRLNACKTRIFSIF